MNVTRPVTRGLFVPVTRTISNIEALASSVLALDPLAMWDFSPGTIFQDAAGTIPAVVHQDPVGLSLDRTVNVNNLRQPTDNDRPLLDIATNGVRGLRVNGVNQFLDATGLTAATGPKTVIAGCITEDGESSIDNYLFDTQSGRIISGAVGNTVGQAGMFSSGGGWTSGGNYDTEALAVLTFRHYATNGGIRANGVEVLTENVLERAIGGAVSVGAATGGASGHLNGVIHVLLVFDRALTDEEIKICENFVAAKQGRSL